MRPELASFLLIGLLATGPSGAETRFDSCIDLDAANRVHCLADRLADRPFTSRVLSEVERLAISYPEVGLELIDELQARAVGPPGDLFIEARLLELRGEASLALGDAGAAANAYLAALKLGDGVTRLTWMEPGVDDRALDLDVGSGRLRRASRALAAAGRLEESRELLERAITLGDRSWIGKTWTAELAAESPPAFPLTAGDWHMPLPEFEIDHFDGEPFSIESVRGDVLALDFWASWCAPCLTELPHMQALYDANRERGMSVLAINVGEPPEVAIPFAKELGLTLPLAVYHSGLDATFEVKALPAVILVDRRGRVRQRWDGYREGLEEQIAETVERLLDEREEVEREVASVLEGPGLLEVGWKRSVPARIAGLTVVHGEEGPGILATSGKWLFLYGGDGRTLERWTSTPNAGLLTSGERDAEGRYRLVGFRPGGTRFVTFEMPEGEYEIADTPRPIFDVLVLDHHGETEGDVTLMAGLDGMWSVTDRPSDVIAGLGTVSGLASGAGEGAVLALEAGKRLVLLDRSLSVLNSRAVPSDSWTLVVDPGRPGQVGVAPALRSATAGAFLDSPGRQLAVVLNSGQLLLLDPEEGRVLFRASWKDAGALAAADLDGNGRDELYVAAGLTLSMLEAVIPEDQSDPRNGHKMQ
jgi:thiol-disulfide isomerase/thioredoxin